MAQENNKLAFVCVPGGFCPSGFFDKAVAKFTELGYPVHAVDLPSVGKRPAGPAGLEDDAEAVRSHVRAFADQGLDVVLVGNSYGGWVITEAAKGISKEERQAAGKEGGLIHLVFLASLFTPRTGISVVELLAGEGAPPMNTDEEGYNPPPPAAAAGALLAPSISEEEKVRYGTMLKPFSDKANHDKLTYLGYEHIPSTMVVTTNDIVVVPKRQYDSFDAATERGRGTLRKVELAGDHCYMISHPEETVRICIEAGSP